MRPVRLPDDVPGHLLLSAMPGRIDGWAAFEAAAVRTNLHVVVCLTPREEIAELSPGYHAAVLAGSLPFRWMHRPVPNFGVPDDREAFRRDVQDIAVALRSGQRVLLHCAAGMGRTGTTAACVLKALGLEAHDAMQRVRDAGSNPQNARQAGLVDWF